MPLIASRRALAALLRQARGWFNRHATRDDAVSVEANPKDVQRWMDDTDHALLDEAVDLREGAPLMIARVAFRYGDSRLFSRLVCLLRGGDSAHCEVAGAWLIGRHECVSSSFLDGGVRAKVMPLPPEKWRIYEIEAARDPRVWCADHAGAKYDVLGLLGIMVPAFGHARTRWFCCEAAADMIGMREPQIFDLRTLEAVCARFGTRVQ